MSLSITFIGTGNVAWHLARALEQAGHVIAEVYGRSPDKTAKLCSRLDNAVVATNLDFSRSHSSLFIIAVSDNAIESVVSGIALPEQAILVHTSGTAPMSLLTASGLHNIGVFYPLQTISRNREISFVDLPLLIEASNQATQNSLTELSNSMKAKTTLATSKDRQGIHLAAVFANNFTNHMIDIAGRIMLEKSLDAALLNPLIRETVDKALTQNPTSAQTGPAVRGDTNTMSTHIQQLEFDLGLQEIYRLVSESIRVTQKL